MDEQGQVIWRKSYKPYGEEQNPPAGNPNPSYTGKPLDAETGLLYMGARSYDPETGRFTGVDPRSFEENNPQSFGRYIYANNSPYVYNDPNGEFGVLLILGAAAGLLALSPNANAPEDQNTPTPALSADGVGVGVAAGVGVYVAGEAGLATAARLKIPKSGTPKSPKIDPKEVAGKTPDEIDKLAQEKGLLPKGSDPKSGSGSYVDPVTGEQRVLSHPNSCNGPHCHVNNPAGERLDIHGNVVPPESPAAHLPLK